METKQKQIQMWVKLILDYCKNNGITELLVESFPVFENRAIERSLNTEMRMEILDTLCQQGFCHLERDGVYGIIEKSVKDWAYTIYNWYIDEGYRGEIMNIDEACCGDRVEHESFYNMKKNFFDDCVSFLRKDGKVQMIGSDSIKWL